MILDQQNNWLFQQFNVVQEKLSSISMCQEGKLPSQNPRVTTWDSIDIETQHPSGLPKLLYEKPH